MQETKTKEELNNFIYTSTPAYKPDLLNGYRKTKEYRDYHDKRYNKFLADCKLIEDDDDDVPFEDFINAKQLKRIRRKHV